MANEKRLIDANAFLDRIKERHDDIMQDPIVDKATKWRESVCFGGVVNELVKMPTVDAVEVCRCKDCEHYEVDRVGIPGGDPRRVYECGYCYHWKYEAGDSPNSVDADDFCSYGERRTNEPEKPV